MRRTRNWVLALIVIAGLFTVSLISAAPDRRVGATSSGTAVSEIVGAGVSGLSYVSTQDEKEKKASPTKKKTPKPTNTPKPTKGKTPKPTNTPKPKKSKSQ